MATFPLYSIDGKKTGTVTRPSLFEVAADTNLIHRYFLWVRSITRNPIAHTKTRGEVSGGGKKPWKQKGTGRARVGSSRNPVWRHGGTAFGPRNDQTWKIRMPRAERRKALFSALSTKADNVIVVDKSDSITSTKAMLEALQVLPIKKDSKVLYLHASFEPATFNVSRNLSTVTNKTVSHMNLLDVLNNDVILLTKDTLSKLEDHFTTAV
jgi:large subunit ribosomal protein L4